MGLEFECNAFDSNYEELSSNLINFQERAQPERGGARNSVWHYHYKAFAQEAIDSMEFCRHEAELPKWNEGTSAQDAFNQMAKMASDASMHTGK